MCVVSRRNHTGSLNCEYDPASLTTKPGKTQGKIGWLGADAVEVTVNLYGPLFTGCEIEVVEDGKTSIKEVSAEEAAGIAKCDYIQLFNKDSHKVRDTYGGNYRGDLLSL